MTETYTLGDFPSGLDEGQLKTDISNSNISINCLDVGRLGDDVFIIFETPISENEKTTLDTIVENYVYVPPPIVTDAFYDPGTSTIKHIIEGTPYTYLGSQNDEIIISKTTQNHYTSIKAAIAAHNNPNIIFVVYPGTYVEDNPLVLPAGAVLKGAGTAQNTVIVAQNPSSDLVVLGRGAGIFNVTLNGATAARGVYLDGSQSGGMGGFSAVMQVFIIDCHVCVESDGKNIPAPGIADTLYCDKVIIRSSTHNCDKGVYVHSGGSFISTSCQVIGYPVLRPFNYGFYCTDARSKISMTTTSSWYNACGAYVNNGGIYELVLITMNYNNIGMHVGPTGVSTVSGDGINFRNSTLYDMDIESTQSQLQFVSNSLDDSKINNPNSVKLNIKFNAVKFGKYLQGTIGDCHFGSSRVPTTVSMGQGGYLDTGVIILSNSDLEVGTWVNNSDTNNYNYPPYDLFPSLTEGNCAYIGTDYNIPGIKVHVTEPTSSVTNLEDLIFEYWNGSTWVTLGFMQTYAAYPCYTYINSFVSLGSKFHIRFGVTSASPFQLKTLNGFNKKWIRIRIVNDISSVPIVQYIKIHTHSQIANDDGFPEYFGDSRPLKTLSLDFRGDTISNLYLASNIEIRSMVLPTGVITRLNLSTVLPTDLDTSFPLKLELGFIGDHATSGDVDWMLRYVISRTGDTIYHDLNDAPVDHSNVKTVQNTTSIANPDIDTRQVLLIQLSDYSTNPSDGMKNVLNLSLERTGTTDTYAGSVYLIVSKCTYVSYIVGTHLLSF